MRLRREQDGLRSGAIGAIVMVYESEPPAYEVEFCDEAGATLALLTLGDDDLASTNRREE